MKILKKLFQHKEPLLFDNKGDVLPTEENGYLIDAILCIASAWDGPQFPTAKLHLELFRCGIYIQRPELMKVLAYMKKEKFISLGQVGQIVNQN